MIDFMLLGHLIVFLVAGIAVGGIIGYLIRWFENGGK